MVERGNKVNQSPIKADRDYFLQELLTVISLGRNVSTGNINLRTACFHVIKDNKNERIYKKEGLMKSEEMIVF